MANSGSRHGPRPPSPPEEDSGLVGGLSTRQLEAFGRKVTATAGHLIGGEGSVSQHYQNALGELHRELRRPMIQRSVFAFAQTTPGEIVRSKLSVSDIQQRALSYVPDELLANIPEDNSAFSLFEGFKATLPEDEEDLAAETSRGRHGKRNARGLRLLEHGKSKGDQPPSLSLLKKKRESINHRLEMMGVRKHMCSAEIREIDNKIANLNTMRKIVLDRLAGLEQEEIDMEHELAKIDNDLEDMEEEMEDAAALTPKSPIDPGESKVSASPTSPEFMSESIYQKLPSPKSKRRRTPRRISMPILHEHLEPGSQIKEVEAHTDIITSMDFDYPFGTMVTSSLDDTVRVWDMNAGRCIGFLEGHLSSVRCLQVEDNIVATGSMDASIRLWDLSLAEYDPSAKRPDQSDEEDDGLGFEDPKDSAPSPPPTTMQNCHLFTLEAHVDEVTALHFRGDTLVSGSSDKTLRQWDLVKGRPVQTLDVLWAAAQASATLDTGSSQWRQPGRMPDAAADFVGALQCFDAALACGTADGMVRLWDLRSGQVHRSLVGHTGPVTALQFDDVHLVTASLDRSIRIWDLRTGSIYDAYAYDNPITSMMFDSRRIVAAAGEPVVRVYDKTDGRQWACGPGANPEKKLISGSNIERVRIKDGYMIEGRRNGVVGMWSC